MVRRPLTDDEIQAAADRAEGRKPNRRSGRPPKYQPSFAKHAEKLCVLGATDEDLADFFEVSVRTVIRWKSEHEEFCQALKVAKERADERVERSLYQRAVGYSFDGEKIVTVKGEVIRVPIREHVPPDVTAQIFWLKNRRPGDWRDKQDHEVTGKNGGPVEVSGYDLARRIALSLAGAKPADE